MKVIAGAARAAVFPLLSFVAAAFVSGLPCVSLTLARFDQQTAAAIYRDPRRG